MDTSLSIEGQHREMFKLFMRLLRQEQGRSPHDIARAVAARRLEIDSTQVKAVGPGLFQLVDEERPFGEPTTLPNCMAQARRSREIRSRHHLWQQTVERLRKAMTPLVAAMLGLPLGDQKVVNNAYLLALEAVKVDPS
jgi:hypothetical protein